MRSGPGLLEGSKVVTSGSDGKNEKKDPGNG